MRGPNQLTAADRERIQAVVCAVELRTRGEIVPVVVPRVAVWVEVWWLLWGLGLVLGTAAYWIHEWSDGFGGWDSPARLLGFQILGALLGLALGAFPSVRRRLLPRSVLDRAVRQAARAAFVEHGLTETQDRSGVLLFVALFEHRVEILADKGIHDCVGPGGWAPHADRVAAGLRDGRFCDALCFTIEALGDPLAAHFPPRPDDRNELPDLIG